MKFFKNIKIDGETISKIMFLFSLAVIIFFVGSATRERNMFPHTIIDQALAGVVSIAESRWYYAETEHTTTIPIYDEQAAYNGLSLVTYIRENDTLAVKIIDMNGELIHNWDIEWFEIWPDAQHVPDSDPYFPQARPGTHIHGTLLAENGDLIFNFEHLGLVRLDICGNTVWLLEERTHHSIYQDEFDNLWVSGRNYHMEEGLPGFPNLIPPFFESTVLKVSMDGEVLDEISLIEVISQNNMAGLLYMLGGGSQTKVSGDLLHLNDVETFPSDLEEGVFQAGDIMVSLRNNNTVFVFRPPTNEIIHINVGGFVRQHDPDFIDGNTISIFDNNNVAPEESGVQSKIIIESLVDNQTSVYYTGNEEHPFFTDIMGKHEWLPNGNMIITDSRSGRAIEIDSEGNIVWEYINLVDDGLAGLVAEVHRLSDNFDQEFFEQKIQQCNETLSN